MQIKCDIMYLLPLMKEGDCSLPLGLGKLSTWIASANNPKPARKTVSSTD